MTNRFDDHRPAASLGLHGQQLRRAVLASVARSAGVVAVIVTTYYLVPVDDVTTLAAVLRILGATVVIAVVVMMQIRAVSSADQPQLRAVEGLAAAVTLMVVLFAAAYVSLSSRDPTAFSEPLGRTGALYFTMTTLTTVGFGDITARTDGARIAVMVQMVYNVAVIGLAVKLILGTARRSEQARRP